MTRKHPYVQKIHPFFFMHLEIQMHIQNHNFCKTNLFSPIVPEKYQQAQIAFKIAIFTVSIYKQVSTYYNDRSSNFSDL